MFLQVESISLAYNLDMGKQGERGSADSSQIFDLSSWVGVLCFLTQSCPTPWATPWTEGCQAPLTVAKLLLTEMEKRGRNQFELKIEKYVSEQIKFE